MYHRSISIKLEKLLASFPAIILTGARQSGKSSLARMMRPHWEYYDLERPVDRDLILQDPDLFFKNHSGSIILDEAQYYPELLAVLRGVIDAQRETRDRFIITGSSSPELLRFSSETLAGRVAVVELSPLKMSEVQGEPIPALYKIFEDKLSTDSIHYILSLKPLRSYDAIIRNWLWGGYPEPQWRNEADFYPLWQENYLRTLVERDIKRLFPGINSDIYRRFLSILKDFHGKSVNMADISRALGISETTVRNYLDIANYSYVWRTLPTFSHSTLKSIVKHPRTMYRDSGMFNFLVSNFSAKALENSSTRGQSFEAFISEELIRGLSWVEAYNVSHNFFRTRGGAEVDLILEGSFGILPIEIKCSSHTSLADVHSLTEFIERENLPLGLVINLSDKVQQISEKIICIPANTI